MKRKICNPHRKIRNRFRYYGSEDSVKLLLLLLKELDWLRKIDKEVERPFAFTLNLSRQKRQVLGEIVDLTEWKKRSSMKRH